MASIYGSKYSWAPMYHAPTARETELEDYFTGPRDIHRHSKWPIFMRLHGSILPKMILPLGFVALETVGVLLLNKYVTNVGVSSVMVGMMGFVIGLSLTFRGTTAYERYMDGRKFWAQLHMTSRNLSRLIWIHVHERHNETAERGRADLLRKLAALNLINAFAISLKHRLKFEPSTAYPDLAPLVCNLHTMAGIADQEPLQVRKASELRAWGQYLGVSFAQPNPRALLRASKENLGNLPLEVLNYIAGYLEYIFENKIISGSHQGHAMTQLSTLTEVLTGLERVADTPLPVAYSIAVAQLTWIYVMLVPFQLVNVFGWLTIPATLVIGYMILGLAQSGRELEDPFGHDVNDLPLDTYCHEIATEIDVLTSSPAPKKEDWMFAKGSKVLYPLSHMVYEDWDTRTVEEIRAALKAKATSKDVKRDRINTVILSGIMEPSIRSG